MCAAKEMSAQAKSVVRGQIMIDVKEFLRTRSVEEINRAAEEFFAKIEDWTYVLAKPFAAPDDCAKLLIEFWAVLQGLAVCPMMDVLDFGAGSCWAAYFLTQMGCKVYACDVSSTALEMGRTLYQKHPPFGNQPPPEFLLFDGFRIPLPDQSVDRILCMHALHHVPNVSHVLAEMARVLRDRDGIAAFTEPGPAHSKSQISQRELENGVLENDIVIEDIGKWARAAGFKRLELTVFPIERVSLSLEDYGRFIAGDSKVGQAVLSPIRKHAELMRTFFLYKEDSSVMWSSSARGLAAELEVRLSGNVFHSGSVIQAEAVVRNTGQAVWLQGGLRAGTVNLGFHLKNLRTGEYFNDYGGRAALDPDHPVEPGRTIRLQASIPAPAPGSYELTFDLVSEWVCWFADRGLSRAVSFQIEVTKLV